MVCNLAAEGSRFCLGCRAFDTASSLLGGYTAAGQVSSASRNGLGAATSCRASSRGRRRAEGLRFALPPLHSPGFSSAALSSLFAAPIVLDDDVQFACRAIACLGPAVREWRASQMRALTKLSKRLAPWERDLVAMMPPSVAAGKRPFFMLARCFFVTLARQNKRYSICAWL